MICQFHHQVTLQPRIRVSSPSTLSIMTRGEEMQSWDPVSDLLRPRISYILSHYQAAPAPGRDPSKSHNIALTRGASVQTPDSDISSPWTEYQYPGSSWADAISPVPAKYSCIPDHVCEWLTDEAPPLATGWELQVAKFSKFSQPGPGSGPGHCAGPGAAWLPGVLAQAPGTCQGLWKVGHCTLYTGALYTVQATPVLYTESLHICICNLLNQIVEKIFTATALIVSWGLWRNIFPLNVFG